MSFNYRCRRAREAISTRARQLDLLSSLLPFPSPSPLPLSLLRCSAPPSAPSLPPPRPRSSSVPVLSSRRLLDRGQPGVLLCAEHFRGLTLSPLSRCPRPPQVPVQLQSLSGKYATAAFTGALSQSEQTLKQVETDLQAIHKLIEANDKSVVFFGASRLDLLGSMQRPGRP